MKLWEIQQDTRDTLRLQLGDFYTMIKEGKSKDDLQEQVECILDVSDNACRESMGADE